VRTRLHGCDVGPTADVVAVAEVDVAGPSDRRKAEAQSTDAQTGPAEQAELVPVR
jgi:hypothetical protein